MRARGRAARLRPKPGPDPAAGLEGWGPGRRFQRPPPPTPRNPTGRRVSAAGNAGRRAEGRLEIPGGPPESAGYWHKVTQRGLR